MFKKIMALVLVIALTATVAVGATVAYLTDRDSEANVFTVGDVAIDLTEDFEQGATLTPGVEIGKKPVITNTGKNDAYVWLTFSIPSALDNYVQGTETGSNENVIHWNPLGATTEGYVTETRVNNAIAAGYLPEGTTAEAILASNQTWNVFNSLGEGQNVYQETINGVQYNTYVLLYDKALEPGETTLPNIYKVFLDATVDIDPSGDWYKVVAGEATKLNWNSNVDGNPVIHVSAYATQVEGFADVKAAYNAYQTQWGTNGTAYGNPNYTVTASTTADLKTALADAVAAGETNITVDAQNANIGNLNYGLSTTTVPAGTTVTIKNATINGQSYGNAVDGTVVFTNCTFTNSGPYSIHFDAGSGDVIFNNCTLSGWCSFGSTINSVKMNNCTINGNGTYAMVRFYQDAELNNCTINCSNANDADVYPDGISAVNGAKVTLTGCTISNIDYEVEEGGKIVVDGVVKAQAQD